MSEEITASPQKVHLLSADQEHAGVQDVLESPSVSIDPGARSVSITGDGRTEEGNIDGDIIASDQALKITCGRDGEELKSIHLVFGNPGEMDSLAGRLEGAGLTVVRSQEDPEYRTESSSA